MKEGEGHGADDNQDEDEDEGLAEWKATDRDGRAQPNQPDPSRHAVLGEVEVEKGEDEEVVGEAAEKVEDEAKDDNDDAPADDSTAAASTMVSQQSQLWSRRSHWATWESLSQRSFQSVALHYIAGGGAPPGTETGCESGGRGLRLV